MFFVYCLSILSSVVAFYLPSPFDIRIDHYKVETTKDLVINTPRPEFSWKIPFLEQRSIQQKAYQIEIKSQTNFFDSRRITSNRSIHIEFFHKNDLQPITYYRFRVRIWVNSLNQTDISSLWTKWIHFRTSIFDFHQYTMKYKHSIHWIGSKQIYMNELRKEFNITENSSIKMAIVFLSGLGYYELYMNGQKIDVSRKLDPGWTTYEKRTLFVSFDVTSNIKSNMNAIGVRLGNGWYSQEQYLLSSDFKSNYGEIRFSKIEVDFKYFVFPIGPPRLFFILHIIFENDHEMKIFSDQTWYGRQGSILYDNIYKGEIIDARNDRFNWSQVDFIDKFSLWLESEIMSSPIDENVNGQFTLQDMPPIRAGPDAIHFEVNISSNRNAISINNSGILKPISISTPLSGIHIIDLGQNMVGWCRIRFNGPRSIGVQIRYAEILTQPVISTGKSSNEIYVENLRSATQTDTYILRGDSNGEIYEPRFTIHGFRYVSIFGSPNSLTTNDIDCPIVHSETTVKGNFFSSNPIINQLQHNIQWSQLGNLMSIPTDCPQRDERKGWLGDAALSVNEALYNFDLIKFYINFLNLIIDIQLPDGSIPDTVPYTSGSYPADPNWGSALMTITWQIYRHYQNKKILEIYYPNIRAYIEYLRIQYKRTGLIDFFYHYGDWIPPTPQPMSNVHLISSFAFLHDISILINISTILNLKDDVNNYTLFYRDLAIEFHRVFFNETSMCYADGMQSAQILALTLPDVVPDSLRKTIFEYLIANIHQQNNHLTTGIISIAHIFPLLSDNGYHDLAVELISTITYPSYGYMFNNPYENATTLWELWDAPFEGADMNSRNHIMFGSVGAWFYSHLAGINIQSDLIVIRPKMLSEQKKYLLDKIDCQLSTLYGLVHVWYTRNENETFANSILIKINIPSNVKAKIIFEPLFHGATCIMLTESDSIIWPDVNKNIDVQHDERTSLISVEIASGQYTYQAFWV